MIIFLFISFYTSTKTYVVGTQKNSLNETILLSFQVSNHVFEMCKKICSESAVRFLFLTLTLILPIFFILNISSAFYTPPLKCGEVLCYTLRCLSVCPSVRPCSPFPIDNLSIYSRNFFKFCIHIVIGDEWYGIVNGQNPSIFNGATALFRIGKMVSGLLFLYCS